MQSIFSLNASICKTAIETKKKRIQVVFLIFQHLIKGQHNDHVRSQQHNRSYQNKTKDLNNKLGKRNLHQHVRTHSRMQTNVCVCGCVCICIPCCCFSNN